MSQTLTSQKKRSETSKVLNDLIGKEIGLNLLHTRRHKESDAAAALGNSRRYTEDEKQSFLQKMNLAKEVIRNYARTTLETKMVAEAISQGVKCPSTGLKATSLKDVQNSFSCDGRIDNGRKMWHVCYHGIFATNDWDVILEEECMKYFNITYKEWKESEEAKKDKRHKGCISKLINSSKNQLVHNINQATSATHKNTVSITRPNSLVKEDGEVQFRRDKNTFYDWCYRKEDGTPVTTTDDDALTIFSSPVKRNKKRKHFPITTSAFALTDDSQSENIEALRKKIKELEAKQKNIDKNNLAQQEAAAINEYQEETELEQSLADATETISSLRKSKSNGGIDSSASIQSHHTSETEESSPSNLSGPALEFYLTNGITYPEHVANKRKRNEERMQEQGLLGLLNKPSETKQKKSRKKKQKKTDGLPRQTTKRNAKQTAKGKITELAVQSTPIQSNKTKSTRATVVVASLTAGHKETTTTQTEYDPTEPQTATDIYDSSTSETLTDARSATLSGTLTDDDFDEQWEVAKIIKYKDDNVLGRLIWLEWENGDKGWYHHGIQELQKWKERLQVMYETSAPVVEQVTKKQKRKKKRIT